jgi:pimeloyl-ACP methyl ester carboxylesterase
VGDLRFVGKKMVNDCIRIQGIPAVLWGEPSESLFIAVHGTMSHKTDDAIQIFAGEAAAKGWRVLSFDLPEHGERKNEPETCKPQNCVHDLRVIRDYAQSIANEVGLFACSIGAYFSLLTYAEAPLAQCLFLSPVLNMERIIDGMLKQFEVSEKRLAQEKRVETPIGQALDWDYYSYVKSHPIRSWVKPTAILCGSEDPLCENAVEFVEKHPCGLTIMEHGEHYFHSDEQLRFFRNWLRENLDDK